MATCWFHWILDLVYSTCRHCRRSPAGCRCQSSYNSAEWYTRCLAVFCGAAEFHARCSHEVSIDIAAVRCGEWTQCKRTENVQRPWVGRASHATRLPRRVRHNKIHTQSPFRDATNSAAGARDYVPCRVMWEQWDRAPICRTLLSLTGQATAVRSHEATESCQCEHVRRVECTSISN